MNYWRYAKRSGSVGNQKGRGPILTSNASNKQHNSGKVVPTQELLENQDRTKQIQHYVQSGVQAEMFANRLLKNVKQLAQWSKKHQVSCYRLYDADLPEYAVAVDIYCGEQCWIVVQEYEPPGTVDPDKADQRLAGILTEIPGVLKVAAAQVFLKIRRRQRNTEQYEKLGDFRRFHVVEEGGCKFWVNFEDYLDTGLFLDHRPIRSLIQTQAKGKRFLNLFAYTGSATVHAAMGGALSSVTVDMSNTYLDWAQRNFTLNQMGSEHKLVRADCLQWLDDQVKARHKLQFDLIFLDPPTFSNSKKMQEVFDIQSSHVRLIRNAAALLAPNGILYFSTNFRRFILNREALAELCFEDISAKTIDKDFARNTKIHYCWRMTHS